MFRNRHCWLKGICCFFVESCEKIVFCALCFFCSAGEVCDAEPRKQDGFLEYIQALYKFSLRNFSASNAAIQPEPAAMTACLNCGSLTSPAAKTPSILVLLLPGKVTM